MSEKQNAKGCAKSIIILFGIGFIAMVAETLLGLLFGGKSFISEFLDSDSEGVNLSVLRFTFWTLVIAVAIFFISGGKIEEIFGKKK